MNGSERRSASSSVSSPDPVKIPWDLSQWFDKTVLLDWVKKEVEALDWANPKLLEVLNQHPNFRPKMMLVLLTWCYATGVFESSEIYHLCHSDPALRALCGDNPPAERSVGHFRRDNRGLIKWALAQVFKKALRTKFNLSQPLLPAGLKRFLDDAALLRLDVARQMDRGASGF
jgi:Transposase domain (DUF772)